MNNSGNPNDGRKNKDEEPIKPDEIKDRDDQKSFKDRLSDAFNNLKNDQRYQNFYNYSQSNTQDIIAYTILIIGIIFLFFWGFLGSLLIGMVAGIYFTPEITRTLQNIQPSIHKFGIVRSLIVAGIFLTLLLFAPGLFLGILFGLLLRKLIHP